MYHVFIANTTVINGEKIDDQIYPTRYTIIDSTSDYEEAFATASNVQQTLPCHCYVGVIDDTNRIIIDSFYGLNKQYH